MELGAYGLRLGGEPPRSNLLTAVAGDAPQITVSRTVGSVTAAHHIDADKATVPLLDGGAVELDRARRTAHFTTRTSITDDELAHPYLAPAAAIHSNWLGRAAFHAGGVLVGGRVWGIVGEREAGKSTLLAAMAAHGETVLTDDLLVLDGPAAYAGPRTLDLRREAAEWLGGSRPLGIAGVRERWRLDLGPAPPSAPLGGWIVPSWGCTIAVELQPGRSAAHLLAPARSITGLAIKPTAFLRAASHRSVQFVRPRDLAQLSAGIAKLLDALQRL